MRPKLLLPTPSPALRRGDREYACCVCGGRTIDPPVLVERGGRRTHHDSVCAICLHSDEVSAEEIVAASVTDLTPRGEA